MRFLVSPTEFSDMLLELMLEFHAWSTARPTRESERTADELEKKLVVAKEAAQFVEGELREVMRSLQGLRPTDDGGVIDEY